MTVLTSVPDVGEGPNVLEHVGAVLALDILHHHEVVLLGPEVFYSTNTCSTWNLQIQYCDFLCAGWWQRDMRPIMLRQKSVSRRLSRAEISSQEVVRHQIPYK